MSSYHTFRFLFFLLAGSTVSVVAATGAPRVREGLASQMLTGYTRGADGQPLAGVGISARAEDSTITTTVYSGDDGFYSFPTLNAGKYDLWTLAVAFGTKRAKVSVRAKSTQQQDFALAATEDFSRQLSGTEWLAALPEDTPENLRMKEVFRNRCTECHSAATVLENRFDAAGWRVMIEVMAHTDYFGIMAPRKAGAVWEHHKEELVSFLTRMRGPGPSPMKFKPYPRPRGEAARVVITEYDMPAGEAADRLNITTGEDWSFGTPSIVGVGSGVHDVHVDPDGNAWTSESGMNIGRTCVRVDTKTGDMEAYKVPAPDGRFARGAHAVISDPSGHMWFDIRAQAGLTGFGDLGRVNPKTRELKLFTPPKEMSSGAGRTLDWDALGRIWMSTNNGALMFEPKTEKFSYFKSPTTNTIPSYGVAGDSEGNGWWTESGKDVVVKVDAKTGETFQVPMQPKMDWADLVTPQDRKIYAGMRRPVWSEQQYPRRLGADKNGNTVWVPNYLGRNLARIDIKTLAVEYFPLPIESNPYYTVVDREHMVWTDLATDDRVAKLDPRTKQWTIFVLPSLGTDTRNIAVDDSRSPVEVWVPYFRTSKVARLQFRTQEQLDTVKRFRSTN